MMVASYAWMKSAGSGSWWVLVGFLVGFGCLRFRELLEVDIRVKRVSFEQERYIMQRVMLELVER